MTPAHDLVSLEYDQHKAEVLRTVASKLSASGVSSGILDLDASYNEAWHALYMALADGDDIDNRIAFLVTVTHRRALNEVRALKLNRRADVRQLDSIGEELDLDSRLDAEIQIRQVREGFQAKLSSRELEAATLCHVYGYTRREAAEAMGVRPKRMEKIMDRASARINSVVETVKSGEHCAELESTIRAFALGLLEPDGEKYQLASDHLEHCPACRREVWAERGLAAIGPPLPLAFLWLAGGAGVGGAAGGAALAGGGKSGAAAGKSASSGGRNAAVTGAAVAAAAVVAVGVALATGVVGGEKDSGGSSDPSMTSASGGNAAGGGSGGGEAAAVAKASRQAEKKAKRKAAERARARRKAQRRREARKAAEVAAAEAAAAEAAVTEAVPAPVYVPPPEPVQAEPVEPEPIEPDPPQQPPKPADQKPITDAGAEFGLR